MSKIKTKEEIYFELSKIMESSLRFTGDKTDKEIIDIINRTVILYAKENKSLMIENESFRDTVTNFLNACNKPYMYSFYFKGGTRYDYGAAKRNILASFKEFIISNSVRVPKKEIDSLNALTLLDIGNRSY